MNSIKNRISIQEGGNGHHPCCDPAQEISASKRVVIKALMKNRSKISLYLRIGKVDTSSHQISQTQM